MLTDYTFPLLLFFVTEILCSAVKVENLERQTMNRLKRCTLTANQEIQGKASREDRNIIQGSTVTSFT